MKETNHKLGIWCLSLLLAIVILLVGRTITGYYVKSAVGEATTVNVVIGVLVVAILGVFIYTQRGNLKNLLKHIISTFAIIVGLFVLFKYVHDLELISALISLTFGVWAMIWTLNARSVLSKGSSMRKYATSFFICLLFVLIFSIWDAASNLLGLEGALGQIRYIIMIFVYTTFVFASYRVYRMGKEFGFVDQSKKIKKALKRNK